LTGSASDLGVAARDAVSLALADMGSTPPTELRVFDDGQRPERIEDVAARIASSSPEVVIGPMTSSVAAAWIPQGDRLGLLTISPTVTSHDFAGRDDGFFRVCATTRAYARRSAEFALQTRGWHRFAVLRDDANRAYTRSWTEFFVDAVRQAGADVAPPVVYDSRRADMSDPIQALASALATSPEVLVIVANAHDTARVAQAVAVLPAPPALLAAEWAATDQLILAGGRAVEGWW
jgi:branched-chain amino acid transport system substrate-binding protein